MDSVLHCDLTILVLKLEHPEKADEDI